jgi:peptidyl-prolyl cis-trans isomerase SurA
MRSMAVLSIAVFLACAAQARGEIIDRIAASVGNHAITRSEIDREIRITAFLDGSKPVFTSGTRRRTADRLAEQALVRRELELSRYPAADPSGIEPMLNALRARHGNAFQKAIEEYEITLQDVRDHLLWRLTFLNFVDVRFRRGVQIGNEEIEAYFEKSVKPVAERANPGRPVDLEQYREQIEQKLEGERVDQELARWLEGARNRIEIQFREDALE